MTNEIEPTKDFQTRMFERIRDQIGDLMTEDDLRKIVASALERALFEPVKELDGYRTIQHESRLVQMIERHLKPKVEEAVREWVKGNDEKIHQTIDATLAKGITAIVSQHFESRFAWPLQQLAQTLQQKGIV